MPIETHADFIEEKNKKTNEPIYLYEIVEYDGTNNLYFAKWNENITFDGQEYVALPISHNDIGENSQNEVDEVQISIANVSRFIQFYLEQYDLRNIKVIITVVWLETLDNPDAKISWTYYIDNYRANEQRADFVLRPKMEALSVSLPFRTYSRNYCQWKFKGVECAYAGGEGECNKTRQRCKELDNYNRFGGFPAIPGRTIYVV